jgi:hypothetical protein
MPLPEPRSLLCAVAGAGKLYAIGGSLMGESKSDVWVATIGTAGAIGPWTATTPLPTPTRWHGCAIDLATSGIFIVGGDDGADARATVLRADITEEGVGVWSAQTSLPSGRRGLGVVIDQGFIYAVGGEEKNGFELRSTVFVAPIEAGGTLGAWSETTPLPIADYMFGAVTSGGTIYTTGGYANGDGVHFSRVSSGTPAVFDRTTSLPEARERHASVALDGYVYVMGGEVTFGGTRHSSTWRAPVVDGIGLGAWEQLTDMLEPAVYASAVSDRGYIYVVGGTSDGGLASVRLLVPP